MMMMKRIFFCLIGLSIVAAWAMIGPEEAAPIPDVQVQLRNAIDNNSPDAHVLIQAALDAGADPDKPVAIIDDIPLDALFYAIHRNCIESLESLLIGVNPNYIARGFTPLTYAISRFNVDAVDVLLEGGAIPDLIDGAKRVPLSYVGDLLEDQINDVHAHNLLEITDLLVDKKVDADEKMIDESDF